MKGCERNDALQTIDDISARILSHYTKKMSASSAERVMLIPDIMSKVREIWTNYQP